MKFVHSKVTFETMPFLKVKTHMYSSHKHYLPFTCTQSTVTIIYMPSIWNMIVLCIIYTLLDLWNNNYNRDKVCVQTITTTIDLVSFTEICSQVFSFSIEEICPSFLWDETKPFWEFIISIFVCNASIFRVAVRFPDYWWVSVLMGGGRQGIWSSGVLRVVLSVHVIVSLYWGKVGEPLGEGPPLSRGASHSLCVDSLTL